MSNDIYFQVGLLTTIGLVSKNAILIVEFAKEYMEQGKDAIHAAEEAVRVRLRPILMTSLAFGLGVLPLAMAHGAGAGAQNAIGVGVLGGMLAGTFLCIRLRPGLLRARRPLPRRQEAPRKEPDPAGLMQVTDITTH